MLCMLRLSLAAECVGYSSRWFKGLWWRLLLWRAALDTRVSVAAAQEA